ncbi:hypothetical protein [Paracidovorax valerianellae]|uniref:Uncharacterized protein n=1 Tax=Paracidovorax valerianellae TaxID=187868 RepID=A0A1G6L068_9BURK|nr:hypothetical protein SAMN05192589_10227 [Paracidovorax valerianellae]
MTRFNLPLRFTPRTTLSPSRPVARALLAASALAMGLAGAA